MTSLVRKSLNAIRKKGWRYAMHWAVYLTRMRIRAFKWQVQYLWYRFLKPHRTFIFGGTVYPLFWHYYNATWLNERTVEVPIVWKKIAETSGRVLEVGNVLQNYFSIMHDVVDKYDHARGVINEDIATFAPKEKYNLIVSISTMEHVGFDEIPQEPEKLLIGLKNLQENCLAKGGTMLITFPIGYNPHLDEWFRAGKLPFTHMRFLRRVHKRNDWEEVDFETAKKGRHNTPFPFANTVVFAEYKTQ